MRRGAAAAGLGFLILAISASSTQDVIANGGTRSLTIYHVHTKEHETITYKRWGSFDAEGLRKLNWILRDWRRDEPTRMDPYLFDLLWEVHRASGSSEAIHVVSAYRSPDTNAMLRRRSRGVARASQHMEGRAVDFSLPDVPIARVRDIGLRLQRGGVGYYPRANNPWVHLDTGSVRHWPKVTREHLVRLFPDGKTVHIPRDGQPLEGFLEARAMIEARGGSVSSGYIDIAEGRATGRSLWQILFGGGEDEEVAPVRGRSRLAERRPAPSAAPMASPESAGALAFAQLSGPASTTSEAPAARVAPARPTRPAPPPTPAPAPAPAQATSPPPAPPASPPAPPPPHPPARDEGRVVVASAPAPAAAEPRRVMIDLPPRRPRDLEPPPERMAVASILLPPPRPADLVPTPRPATPAAQGTPPPGAAPIRTAAVSPPSHVSAFAPQPQPVAQGFDRSGLAAILSQTALERQPRIRPATPSVTVAAAPAPTTMSGRFVANGGAMPAMGFSGPTLRPLGESFRRNP